LLLTDIGLPVRVPTPSSLDLLAGSPVAMGAIAGSGAWSVLVRGLLLLVPVLGIVGLFISRRVRVARTGILLALGGLALAGISVRMPTGLGGDVSGSGLAPVNGWGGVGVSLALSGFLTAALPAGEAIWSTIGRRATGGSRTLSRQHRKDAETAAASSALSVLSTVSGDGVSGDGLRRLRTGFVVAACLVLLAPVTVGAVWSYQAHRGSNPQVLALRPTTQQVPLIAEQFQGSATAGRVLKLTSTSEGLQATIWRGPGTQISDALPGAVNAQARSRASGALNDPRLRPTRTGQTGRSTASGEGLVLEDTADAELAQIVTRATAGQDTEVADALAAHGIAVVLLTDKEGDAVTAEARVGLASTPGLEQLAQTAAGNSWRVTSSAYPDSARLNLIDEGGEATPVASTGAGSGTRTRIPVGSGTRTLVMVERADAGWEGDDYAVTLSGEVREAELFGENLVLRRTVSSRLGEASIAVADEVVNEGFTPQPMMFMYHCNVGWPLLSESAEIVIPSIRVAPRDEAAARDEADWSTVQAPVPDKPESVFIHTLAAEPDGSTFASVANPELGIALVLEFSVEEFPYFMQWKSMAAGDYVVGLEPSNSSILGRGHHEERGDLHILQPQASEVKHLTVSAVEGREAIARLRRRRDGLVRRGGIRPVL